KELIVFHAVATPYRERSHFDGQDLLENGTPIPHGAQDGWLNRALAAHAGKSAAALAVGQNVPLILRGSAPATSWAPEILPPAEEDTIARLMDLYAEDKLLGPALGQALATTQLLAETGTGNMKGEQKGFDPAKRAALIAKSVGAMLVAPDGPR